MSLLRLVANNAMRRLGSMFPAYFGNQKHNHARDFGYPEHVEFGLLWEAYRRNPLARAAVDKTVGKTWETLPYLQEFARDDGDDAPETTIERAIRQRLTDIRGWQVMMEADRRAMVGGYAGVILRIADDRRFDEPVDSVRGGIDALVEIIPAWKGQLEVSEWDTDQASVTYGQPKMFQFNEASVGDGRSQPRQFQLHPDRVVVWSEDGTVHARSALEPGYNALLDLDKIRGAGGEGFWKNAKSAPVLEVDATTDIQQMAKAMGISPDEVLEKMNAQVEDWQKGFDQLLMLQGMKADTLQVQLPSPEHFFAIALQSFAASVQVPLKILVGSQTGERASTEDADEWARVNMARRTNLVVPTIMAVVARLERFQMIPEADWHLDWADLTEASMAEKIERADKMADVNVKMKDTGEFIFTPEEIRGAVGLEPLGDDEKFRDDADEDLQRDALRAADSDDDA